MHRQLATSVFSAILITACASDKSVARALLKQINECVTVAGPPDTTPVGTNPRLEACLRSKGWSQDSASAASGSFGGVFMAGLNEAATNGRAAGDSVMRAEGQRRLRDARISSIKSDLKNLVVLEDDYFSRNAKYTTPVACSSHDRGEPFCLTEGNSLASFKLTHDGWGASIANDKMPGFSCTIFIGKTPVAPATLEGLPECR